MADTPQHPNHLDVTLLGKEYRIACPPEEREAFYADVEDYCRPSLFKDGNWTADYVRLRFLAIRPE